MALHSSDGQEETAVRECVVAGSRMRIPDSWAVTTPGEDRLLVAVEPHQEGTPFRANLVVTVSDNDGLTFGRWQNATGALLPDQVTMYQLLDLEHRTIAGHPGGRRLAQHVVDGTVPVTMEQWFTQVDEVGYTLTATVDTLRYDAYAGFFAAVAEEWAIPDTGTTAQRALR